MKRVKTYWANIYVGTGTEAQGIKGNAGWEETLERQCQDYVDEVGLCVSVTIPCSGTIL